MRSFDGMCQMLISRGHNTEFRNPYKYAMKDLFRVYDKSVEIYNQNLANESMSQQAAAISTISKEGSTYFREYIKKLTGQ